MTWRSRRRGKEVNDNSTHNPSNTCHIPQLPMPVPISGTQQKTLNNPLGWMRKQAWTEEAALCAFLPQLTSHVRARMHPSFPPASINCALTVWQALSWEPRGTGAAPTHQVPALKGLTLQEQADIKQCVHCLVVSGSLQPHGTVAHQAPMSMKFSRHKYWSGYPFLSPGHFPNPGRKSTKTEMKITITETKY